MAHMRHGVRHGMWCMAWRAGAWCLAWCIAWWIAWCIAASAAAAAPSHTGGCHAAQAMCTPIDGRCEPRDWWYNLSIQVPRSIDRSIDR